METMIDEYKELCPICERRVGRSNSPRMFRIIMDYWTYPAEWKEIVAICERCFTDIFLGGLKLRGLPRFEAEGD